PRAGRGGATAQGRGETLAQPLHRLREAGPHPEQLLDLTLELSDLAKSFDLQLSGPLLRLEHELLRAMPSLAVHLLAPVPHQVEGARQGALALAQPVDPVVQVANLELHRIRALRCGIELGL